MDFKGNRYELRCIACGLLYQRDWCPGSIDKAVITVDGREIEFYSHHGKGRL